MHWRSSQVRSSSLRLPVSMAMPWVVAMLTTSSKLMGFEAKYARPHVGFASHRSRHDLGQHRRRVDRLPVTLLICLACG